MKLFNNNIRNNVNTSLRKSIHHPLHKMLRDALIDKRKELGLTQRDLAKKLNVTHSVVGKIETGDRRLDIIEFYEYAKALDMVATETLAIIFNNYKNSLKRM